LLLNQELFFQEQVSFSDFISENTLITCFFILRLKIIFYLSALLLSYLMLYLQSDLRKRTP